MNSTKLFNAAKLVASVTKPTVRCIAFKPVLNRQLMKMPSYDDAFFGMASNLMRNLEREFDFMNRQFNRAWETPSLADQNKTLFKLDDVFSMDDLIEIDPENGNRNFKLNLSLKGFDPEDIKVNTEGQTLCVSARKEKKTDNEFFLRETTQSFNLPKDLKITELKSKWTDGTLSIEAPLPKLLEQEKEKKPKEQQIAIEHKSLE